MPTFPGLHLLAPASSPADPYSAFTSKPQALSPPPLPHTNGHHTPRLPLVSLPTSCLREPLNNPSHGKTATHCSADRDQNPEHVCKVYGPPPPLSSSAHNSSFLSAPQPHCPPFSPQIHPVPSVTGPLHWPIRLPEILFPVLCLFNPYPRDTAP